MFTNIDTIRQETQMAKDAVWDPTLFECAKSSLIFEIIEREKSVGDLVSQAMLCCFKGVEPAEYNRSLVQVSIFWLITIIGVWDNCLYYFLSDYRASTR